MNASEPSDESGAEIQNGGAAAAILSAGVGCFLVSFLGLLGDVISPVAHFFNFYKPTGPLSGVTTSAIIGWLALWGILCKTWKGRSMPMGKISGIAFLLLILGFLLSFPPFGDLL